MNQEQTYRRLALGIGVIATCVWAVASGVESSAGGNSVVVVRSSQAGGAVAVGGVVVPEKEIRLCGGSRRDRGLDRRQARGAYPRAGPALIP
jgi:hypothetical protein